MVSRTTEGWGREQEAQGQGRGEGKGQTLQGVRIQVDLRALEGWGGKKMELRARWR